MAGERESAAIELLRPILDYFLHRDERKAVKSSGQLRFWPDGMLAQLREISDGNAKTVTYKSLEKKLNERERQVQRTIMEMLRMRDKLGGGRVAEVIELDRLRRLVYD
jgi:hypothetical protein